MKELTAELLEDITGGTEGTVGKNMYYVVQQGDTWESVAEKFGVRVDILKRSNAGRRFKRGMKLLVHGTFLGTAF